MTVKAKIAFVRRRIVSGGQSGVDRAALDAARAGGLGHGGWCPKGRWAEDGRIADYYRLREAPVRDPAARTWLNVRDSGGTLVLVDRSGWPAADPGTRWTLVCAARLGRPVWRVALCRPPPPARLARQLGTLHVLNVAGPRESRSPGIESRARAYLAALFDFL